MSRLNGSINKKSHSSNKKRPNSASYKKGYQKYPHQKQFNRSDSSLLQFTPQEYKKIYVCDSAKKIAMIHAYQPKILKKCLVTNPMSYKKFYNQNQGLCLISNLYSVSFLAHFRQWKRSLKNQLFKIIALIIKIQIPVLPEQINRIVQLLNGFQGDLALALQTDIVSKQKQIKMSAQAGELHKKFVDFRKYAQKLIQILYVFCHSIQQINKAIDDTLQQKISVKNALTQIKAIGQKFKQKIKDSMSFCSAHSDSEFMSRAEFKIQQRFLNIQKQSKFLIQSMVRLAQHKKNIKASLSQIQDDKKQLDLDELDKIINVLNQKDGTQSKSKNYSKNKYSDNALKFHHVTQKLQQQIKQLVKQLIESLKKHFKKIIIRQQEIIRNQSLSKYIEDKGQVFKLTKMKILRLSKIFNKNIDPQIYDSLNNFIKETSICFSQVMQIHETLFELQNEKIRSDSKNATQKIDELRSLVLKFEQNRNKICNCLLQIISKHYNENYSPQFIIKQSDFFQNLTLQSSAKNNDIDKYLIVPERKLELVKKKKQLLDFYTINNSFMIKLREQIFPAIKNIINEDQSAKKVNQIVQKFVIFIKVDNQGHNRIMDQINTCTNFINQIEQLKNVDNWSQLLSNIISLQSKYLLNMHSSSPGNIYVSFIQRGVQILISNYVLRHICIIQQTLNKPINSLAIHTQKQSKCASASVQLNDVKNKIKNIIDYSSNNNKQKKLKQNSSYILYIKQIQKNIDLHLKKLQFCEQYQSEARKFENELNPNILLAWADSQLQFFINKTSSSNIQQTRSKMQQLFNSLSNKFDSFKNRRQLYQILQPQLRKEHQTRMSHVLRLKSHTKFSHQNIDKSKQYRQFLFQIYSYFRTTNVFHIQIYCQNEDPFTLFVQDDDNDYKKLLTQICNKIQLNSQIDKSSAMNKFSNIQPKKYKNAISNCICYKFKDLKSLQKLAKSIQGLNLQPQYIRNNLNYEEAGQIFEQPMTEPKFAQKLRHIFNYLRQNGLQEAVGMGQTSKATYLLGKLINDIDQQATRQNRIKSYSQLLNYIGYKCQNILQNSKTANKIYICSYGNHGQYGYSILTENLPMNTQPEQINISLCEIQKFFLRQLFGLKSSKKTKLQQTHSLIQKLNKQLNIWSAQMSGYKKHPLKNMKQIENKINQYIKPKLVSFLKPQFINFESYNNFLRQIKTFIEKHYKNEILHVIQLQYNNKHDIFYSLDKNTIGSSIWANNDYSIIPKSYTGSQYIKKNNYATTTINVKKIVQQQVSKLELLNNNDKSINPSSLIQDLSSSIQLKQLKQRIQKDVNNDHRFNQEAQIITHTLNVLGQSDLITIKMAQNQKQNSIIKQIYALVQGLQYEKENTPKQNDEILYLQKKHYSYMSHDVSPKLSSTSLQKIHNFFNKYNIKHKIFKYRQHILRITSPEARAKNVLTLLGVTDQNYLKFVQQQNCQFKIQNFYIYVYFSSSIKPQSPLQKEILNRYSIHFKSNSIAKQIKSVGELIDHPQLIICSFPKKEIQLTIVYKQNNVESVVHSSMVSNYQYGNKYWLKCFQSMIQSQYPKIVQRQEAQKKLLTKERIKQTRKVTKNILKSDILVCFCPDEDQQCNISFTLSDNALIQ